MLRKLTGTFILYTLCGLLPILQGYADSPSYGLNFRSHESVQDERTWLDLNPAKPFRFRKGFSLEFDLKLNSGMMYYGYVFRININDSLSVDMLTQLDLGRISFLAVDSRGIIEAGEVRGYTEDMLEERWCHVKIDVEPGKAACIFDGNEIDLTSLPSRIETARIRFGKNDHPVFNTSDVPPMSVRDVMVDAGGKGKIAHWLLGAHDTDGVYDEISGRYASAGNADWQIDRHVKWEKAVSIPIGGAYP